MPMGIYRQIALLNAAWFSMPKMGSFYCRKSPLSKHTLELAYYRRISTKSSVSLNNVQCSFSFHSASLFEFHSTSTAFNVVYVVDVSYDAVCFFSLVLGIKNGDHATRNTTGCCEIRSTHTVCMAQIDIDVCQQFASNNSHINFSSKLLLFAFWLTISRIFHKAESYAAHHRNYTPWSSIFGYAFWCSIAGVSRQSPILICGCAP